jgi:hypothetical protein
VYFFFPLFPLFPLFFLSITAMGQAIRNAMQPPIPSEMDTDTLIWMNNIDFEDCIDKLYKLADTDITSANRLQLSYEAQHLNHLRSMSTNRFRQLYEYKKILSTEASALSPSLNKPFAVLAQKKVTQVMKDTVADAEQQQRLNEKIQDFQEVFQDTLAEQQEFMTDGQQVQDDVLENIIKEFKRPLDSEKRVPRQVAEEQKRLPTSDVVSDQIHTPDPDTEKVKILAGESIAMVPLTTTRKPVPSFAASS